MQKKIISDIIVKKSIRQIPLSVKRPERRARVVDDSGEEDTAPERSDYVSRAPGWQRRSLNPKFAIWLIAGVCILALFFGVSMLFSSATVIITPRTEKISFTNESFTAKSVSPTVVDLAFEVLNVKQVGTETVIATEDKEVSIKASGKIVIYNSYSATSQRLINNTRFESKGGKIYRINTSVIVPGFKKVDGKVVPGSVEATVYADQAGESYNMKLSDLTGDFKIPGFKGDPRYQGFYGLLKTDITGGLVGKQRVVSPEVRKLTEESIKIKLKEQLLKELYAIKPENYIIFKDGYSIDYTVLADSAVDSDKAKLSIEGNLNGIVFNNLRLTKNIATKKLTGFDGLPAELVPGDDFTVTFTGKDNTGLWKNSVLDLKFNGQAVIKWQYSADEIRADLAGKSESDLKNIVSEYKNSISAIQVMFQPVWTRYFPDNPMKIKIKEEI
jgi:hypothetical protein